MPLKRSEPVTINGLEIRYLVLSNWLSGLSEISRLSPKECRIGLDALWIKPKIICERRGMKIMWARTGPKEVRNLCPA
jgi:hypothetical protein